MAPESMAPGSVQVLRLRLPAFRRPLHVLRHLGVGAVDGPWSGSDPLFTGGGAVRAAHSRGRLLGDYEDGGRCAPSMGPVLILDATLSGRALARPPASWSGTVRGTLVNVDDLLWDAAAALDDRAAGDAIEDPEGFHAQYLYVWGDRPTPLPSAARLDAWHRALSWFTGRLNVVDRYDRRFAKRR